MTTAFRIIFLLILATAALAPAPINGMNPRKLDDTTPAAGSPDDQLKCGGCPCNQPCYSSPPPPPPPSPSPPPPKKPSPTPANCPPPPSGGGGGGGGGGGSGGGGGGGGHEPPDYIYVTGPPGDVYPVDQSISAARRSFTVAPEVVAVVGTLLGVIAFW